MNAIPELTDFLSLFEAEPEILDPEVGWECGASFRSDRGDDRIEAIVAPADARFEFRWWQNGLLRADLQFDGVIGWRLECTSELEMLSLQFQATIVLFRLRLKPDICISCVTE